MLEQLSDGTLTWTMNYDDEESKHLQLIGVHVITKDLNENGGLLLRVLRQ